MIDVALLKAPGKLPMHGSSVDVPVVSREEDAQFVASQMTVWSIDPCRFRP
jgi:hypothetical protein